MIRVKDDTMAQLLLAAGIARKIRRTDLVRVIGKSQAYYTKMMKEEYFNDLVKSFTLFPADKDEKEYRGLGTLLKTVGRYIYSIGENLE